MKTITVGELAAFVEPLTGFKIDELTEMHIAAGSISFVTKPHPVAGSRTAGVVAIVPDEPEGESEDE